MPEEQKNLEIIADHIGPIISLKNGNGGLSNKGKDRERNLIFAKNGMGKSFLSRAFRYLDLHQQGEDINEAAHYLVSKESKYNKSALNKGEFEIRSGSGFIGKLRLTKGLNKDAGIVEAKTKDRIFHVFSSDFIEEQLSEKAFQLSQPDSDMQIEIIVGEGNVKLKNKEGELKQKKVEKKQIYDELSSIFESDKNKMKERADIRKSLGAFAKLNFDDNADDALLHRYKEKPSSPEESSSELERQLEKLKSIPASLRPPEPIKIPHSPVQKINEISKSLKKETPPAFIKEDIKNKIAKHPEFFETGVGIYDPARKICPFCEQDTTSEKPHAIIEAYINYFQDAEAKHKKELENYKDVLRKTKGEFEKVITNTNQEKSHYDDLKSYIPSHSGTIEPVNSHVKAIIDEIEKIEEKIAEKEDDLTKQLSASEECRCIHISYKELLKSMIANEVNFRELKKKYDNQDKERRDIQNSICEVFEIEFAAKNHAKISEWHTIVEAIQEIENNITELKKKEPKASVRERVAQTFQELLHFFFENKYTFCEDTFAIKLGKGKMPRETDRTLSDGEKTIIAFCWFIASIHLKVKRVENYKKLFLVFDDPITSLSYEYIFSMADILKSLSISDAGETDITPQGVEERPSILILTHSDSFFNICFSNTVIPKNACFALEVNNNEHRLNKFLEKHVIPFRRQLQHIYMVKERKKCPEHYTANSIRSVLEFFFRICKPDEAKDLNSIASAIKTHYGLHIHRILLHSSSHPGDIECNPSDEIIKACEDTITVINELAPGQIDSIKKMLADEEDS